MGELSALPSQESGTPFQLRQRQFPALNGSRVRSSWRFRAAVHRSSGSHPVPCNSRGTGLIHATSSSSCWQLIHQVYQNSQCSLECPTRAFQSALQIPPRSSLPSLWASGHPSKSGGVSQHGGLQLLQLGVDLDDVQFGCS